jgi:hypothetical protein
VSESSEHKRRTPGDIHVATSQSLADFSKACEYHAQHLAIAKEVGDRAGEGMAQGNLGNAYRSLGDVSKACEYHAQDLAIATEVGDRAGEGAAHGNLMMMMPFICSCRNNK